MVTLSSLVINISTDAAVETAEKAKKVLQSTLTGLSDLGSLKEKVVEGIKCLRDSFIDLSVWEKTKNPIQAYLALSNRWERVGKRTGSIFNPHSPVIYRTAAP